MTYFIEGEGNGIRILNHALKNHPNFYQKLNIERISIEIENFVDYENSRNKKNMLELRKVLEKLERYHTDLNFLHRHFFKELMSDAISYSKIEQINRKIASMTENCQVIGQDLISSNEFSLAKAETVTLSGFAKNVYNSSDNLDIPLDGVENNAAAKKELLFRSALSLPEPHRLQKLGLGLFLFVTASLVLASIVLSVVLSQFATKDIIISRESCRPLGASSLLLGELRTTQALLEVFGRNDSQSVQGFQFHKTRLAAYSQSLQALIDQEKSSSNNIRNYVNGKYEILIPALDAEGSISSTPLFTTSTIQNATVFDIVHMIMKHEQIIFNYGMDDYNKTLESFSVMFLMLNRDRAENAFQSYCLQSVSDIKVSAGKYANAYLIFYSCSVFIYLVIGFIIVGVARYQCSNSNQLIKLLELYISKNIIGKIYHYLGKRGESDEYAARSNNSTIRPSTMVVGYGFALIFCTVICLSLLCAGTITISNYAASTIQSLSRITKTLLLLQKVQSRLAELFLFNKMDGSSALNDPKLAKLTNFSTMYSEIHPLIQDLQQTWNTELSDLSKLPSYNQYISSLTGTSQCNNTGNPKACDGLNNGITNFVMNSDQLSELLQSDSYISSSKEVFKNYLDSFLTATDTTNLLLEFLEYFIYLTAKPDMVIIIVFSIFGILETLIFGYFLYSSCNSHWRDVHQLRLMLNYIPWEILDANEKLRNYVLHYDLSNGKGFLGRSKMKDDGSGGDEETRVSNILNSAVDGVILCNEKGEIDLFNPSAQKMFGIKSSDAKGMGVFTLFDQEAVGKVKSIIDIMCKNLALEDANEKKNSDSIDIDCFRKNQTKFPARINFFATLFGNNPVVTFFVKDITSEKKQQTLLEEEKKKSESLLLNILPEAVALRLKSGETYIAEKFTDVTVFFSDLVGFTKLSSNMEPIDLVKMLSVVVNEFDTLTDKYGLEKIKTIGDAYFCVGGHNNPQSDHPERALRFAIDAMTVIHNYNVEQIKEIHNNPELKRRLFADAKEGEDMSLENKQLNIRMGMNTGGVVAGVIGTKKFAYDLWGDTINMASRMESTSLPGRVHMSEQLTNEYMTLGKGVCQTYLLNNEHHQSSVLTIEEIEQLLGGQMKAIIEEVTDPFANIDLFRSDNYSFPKLVTNAEFVAAMKEFLTDFKTDIAEFYLTLINQFKSNANVSERYEVASTLVTTFLAEEAPRRLKFKFMKNAFGPFQLKFNQCNSSFCPVDLFDNFSNLSIKTLKPEFPKFLKSNPFLTFLKKLKKQDPDTLFKYLRVGKDGSSTHDSAEEEDEKEFILFCEKCGTEIINLENHRFNDWEFDHRIEGMTTFADWRIHTETPEGKTYLSPEVDHNHLSNSRRHTQIKYHYTMDCSAEALFNLWIDPDYFKCRELTIESSNLIDFVKVGKYAHAIYHEILKMSFPQQDRELLHAYCCRKDPEQKRFLCVSRSINNPKVSEGSTYVRAEIKSAFMVEETDENKCTYTYTIIYDPMGWLNADHYFTTFKESNKDVFHDELKKMVKERGAKKSHKPPEVGGLVDSLRYSIEMRSKKP
ncbi:hypothetical protein C9374_001956 [Naegleria lovaniensis]|uniref:Adenylate and Guanylate cyclase catalytic domain containing protein n=1 Tax=Naegleria lovaniensis TaxID=51637 RepID=A0AA88KMW1_NAELO|nr:uncharacterized protein C9374_001956 [Naegleria lovaniensis]KAG2386921.1 hypothetical protein C9374_001956 [Naegleria lovaniensis]